MKHRAKNHSNTRKILNNNIIHYITMYTHTRTQCYYQTKQVHISSEDALFKQHNRQISMIQ